MSTDELKRLAEAATPGPWVAKDWASTDSDGAIDVCGVSVMSPKEMCGIFTVSLEGDETNDVDYIAAANPAAILELIAERDALKAELERIKSLPPVAWEVYVADADNAYVVESLDDPQLIDDCTNSDAVVTPLIALGSNT